MMNFERLWQLLEFIEENPDVYDKAIDPINRKEKILPNDNDVRYNGVSRQTADDIQEDIPGYIEKFVQYGNPNSDDPVFWKTERMLGVSMEFMSCIQRLWISDHDADIEIFMEHWETVGELIRQALKERKEDRKANIGK